MVMTNDLAVDLDLCVCGHPLAWHMLGWPEDMPGADICHAEACPCLQAEPTDEGSDD